MRLGHMQYMQTHSVHQTPNTKGHEIVQGLDII